MCTFSMQCTLILTLTQSTDDDTCAVVRQDDINKGRRFTTVCASPHIAVCVSTIVSNHAHSSSYYSYRVPHRTIFPHRHRKRKKYPHTLTVMFPIFLILNRNFTHKPPTMHSKTRTETGNHVTIYQNNKNNNDVPYDISSESSLDTWCVMLVLYCLFMWWSLFISISFSRPLKTFSTVVAARSLILLYIYFCSLRGL